MKAKSNLLITGANGFIGQNLVASFQSHYNVYSLVNGQQFERSGNHIVCDLTNHLHINQLLKEELVLDVLIHCATKMTNASTSKAMTVFYENIAMYENISEISKHYNVQKIINFSSIAVYPNQDGEHFEHSLIRPSINAEGLYGLSKFCGENLLDLFHKETNTQIVHCRVAQTYGQGMREDRIFKIMQKELEETNVITIQGNGERVSGFIKIDFLVKCIDLFIQKQTEGVYNIGEENLTYRTLAQNIINQYGNNSSHIKVVPYGVSSKCFINCDKLNSLISAN